MKIIQLNGVCGIGSTGRTALEMAQATEALGHTNYVYYSLGQSDYAHSVKYMKDWQRKVHAICSRVSGLQGYFSYFATKAMLRQWEQIQPDVVHLRVLHGNCVHFPTLFRWLRKHQPKVVITLHDCFFFTGKCTHPVKHGCTKYQTGCGGCHALDSGCPSWFFDWTKRMLMDKKKWIQGLDHFAAVAPSRWMLEQAEQSFLPRERLHMIYNWIDTDIFSQKDANTLRHQLGLEGMKVLLGVADHWGRKGKGLADLVKLAEMLPKNAVLLLIGIVLPDMELPANIRVIGRVDSREQLAEYYSLAEVYLNPSKFESFGKTTVEAMACGTPAIVYDVTACTELIGPGCGEVVPLQEGAEGFARAALKWLDNAGENHSAACSAYAKAEFCLSANLDAYLRLYDSL